MGKIFGKRADGQLEICRAKSENRGRGRCHHGDHVEVTDQQLKESFLQSFNEKALAEQFESVASVTPENPDLKLEELKGTIKELEAKIRRQETGSNRYKATQRALRRLRKEVIELEDFAALKGRGRAEPIPHNTPSCIHSAPSGVPLSRDELLAASSEIASQLSARDWKFLEDFQEDWDKRASNGELSRKVGGIAKSLEEYLEKGYTQSAVKMRAFLGPGISLKDFSEILTGRVGAMTLREPWRSRARNVSRMVLTAVDNDMTKSRYVASIVFFGGRCCYCNVPLQRRPPPSRQASGEHLTAVSSQDGVLGGTRSGNMALACVRCNRARGNLELVEFIQTSETIDDDQRPAVLGRIEAFRRFAVYQEHSEEKSARIRSAIDRFNRALEAARAKNPNKELTREEGELFKAKLNAMISELQGGE